MAKFRAPLILFVAALLFWQSGLAAAHCLRAMSHGGDAVEICSIDGVRVIHLDDQGNPLADQPSDSMAGGFCPVCHGMPAVALPEPPMLALPAWTGEAVAWHAAGEARLLPPARAPPYRTRAPPILTA
ncbi:DUF2946 family protein [Roseococcus pinisoli]|uniref:DUF2946 family protein n=1 Tax=Roseococcus pinisoli TaxID=2835040 RepID=A0ABS5QC51_9PROT|nr:DUF2946 family protein [Roseococcus pinisoli]